MKWDVIPSDPSVSEPLLRSLGISDVLADLLVARGFDNEDAARAFLRPKLDDLLDPYGIADMDRAVERVRRAIRDGERVLIYGDYDVDGVSGTALLMHFFRLQDVDVQAYIPNRLTEGYSMNAGAVREIVARGIGLVISIDNGTGAGPEITELARHGVDVVVTDHHENEGDLPPACAVVNPKRVDCPYPFKLLAGVGVAFKLVSAISRHFTPQRRQSPEFREFLLNALALTALGTISDVVPLVGENRILAKYGLAALSRTELPGIRELLRVSKVSADNVAPWDIGFRIGPRLNAAGRLGDAPFALELLLETSSERARTSAVEIDRTNTRRQQIEREIFDECRSRLANDESLPDRRTIVLANDGWHRGVLGIVAAKLAGEFHRPTILFSFEGEEGRGSARSVRGFNVLEAIRSASDPLTTFGGHAFAAGLEVPRSRFEEFVAAFEAATSRLNSGRDFVPSLRIDRELPLRAIRPEILDDLGRLAPHGEQNPAPVFLARNVRVAGPPRLMGRKNQHLQLWLNDGEASFRAIGFHLGEEWIERLHDSSRVDAVYQVRKSQWNGRNEIEIQLKDLREV